MADSWKNWYTNRMKERYNVQPFLESENLELTLEEAHKAVKDLNLKVVKKGLTEYESALLQEANRVIENDRRDQLKLAIGKVDPGVINSEYEFLNTLDEGSSKEVIKAQKILSKYGYYEGELDSLYGGQTTQAVDEFKSDVSGDPKFTIDWILEQAKGIFDFFD
jgi:hypothetical protein